MHASHVSGVHEGFEITFRCQQKKNMISMLRQVTKKSIISFCQYLCANFMQRGAQIEYICHLTKALYL